jgi:hypothetical protein
MRKRESSDHRLGYMGGVLAASQKPRRSLNWAIYFHMRDGNEVLLMASIAIILGLPRGQLPLLTPSCGFRPVVLSPVRSFVRMTESTVAYPGAVATTHIRIVGSGPIRRPERQRWVLISLAHLASKVLNVVFIMLRGSLWVAVNLGDHRLTSGEYTRVIPHSRQALTSMVDPPRYHVVFYEVVSEGTGPVIVLGVGQCRSSRHE